ncbi:six-hairpin glycosidase [Fusarium beomiforme]|uniref:Six-hairpin glycosidase n=1 Tax=Fusarium beomiforme TaxID=44412 RepID=A0A9P5DQY3_9HYPO|nr:six-hairpin glycosidase [Fusarium beomiforme]
MQSAELSKASTIYPQQRFLHTSFHAGSFWARWRHVAYNSTIPAQLSMLKRTGRYRAFDLQWQEYYTAPKKVWPVPEHFAWDSDIGKFVEGVCYFLHEHPNPELRAEVDYLVDLVINAQQPDGYLGIHYTVVEPGKRWTNIRDMHELYNMGHLMEAAVAHKQLTGQDKFVRCILRLVDHLCSVFGREEGKLQGYCGHPEIELALLRLFNATGETKCLDLAEFFLTERGQENGRFYTEEQAHRGEHPQVQPDMFLKPRSYWYMSAQQPIVDTETIEGHAVRALYLYVAAADLGTTPLSTKHKDITDSAWRLWRNMSTAKTAVTGGVGSIYQTEGFALNYQLFNSVDEGGSYNETCASIAQLMLADRLQLVHGLEAIKIGDVAERVLYNSSVTTGMSLDGSAFTYENPVASCEGFPGKRHQWFDVCCCPPNVLRTLGILGGYMWSPLANGERGIAIHHPFAGDIEHRDLRVSMETDYPFNGAIRLRICGSGSVKIRIPGWACEAKLPEKPGADGYLTLAAGTHRVDFAIRPRLIYSHPYTRDDHLTLAVGPLVYCLEDVDNPFEKFHFKHLTIHESILDHLEPMLSPDGVTFYRAAGQGRQMLLPSSEELTLTELEHDVQLSEERLDLVFIPYYYRANRAGGHGQYRVGLKRRHIY